MEHELDPRAPLVHSDGTAYSEEERYAFFEKAKSSILGSYKDDRSNSFTHTLPIGDQLDLIWHELNDTGVIARDGPWFTAVKAIKEASQKNDDAYQKAVADVIELRKRYS